LQSIFEYRSLKFGSSVFHFNYASETFIQLFSQQAVALWDTEGTSDPNGILRNELYIFGLSIYFSSVVILNVKDKIIKGNIVQLQVSI